MATASGGSGTGTAPGESRGDLFKNLEAVLAIAPMPMNAPAVVPLDERGKAAALQLAVMPKFLSDRIAAEPGPLSRLVQNRAGRMSAVASAAVCVLLGAWVVVTKSCTLEIPQARDRVVTASLAEPRLPSRFEFVAADKCAGRPCGALLEFASPSTTPVGATASLAADANAPAAHSSPTPKPSVSYTTAAGPSEPSATVAGTALDPLGTVIVSGLPPNSRLSAGTKISDTEWALAVGDLGRLGLVVPSEHKDPIRATFEIKNRDGEQVAIFDLNIARDGNAAPPASATKKHVKAQVPPESKTAKTPAIETSAKPAAPVQNAVPKPPAMPSAVTPPPEPPKNASPPREASTVKEADTGIFSWLSFRPKEKAGPTPGFETLINLGGGFFAFDPTKP